MVETIGSREMIGKEECYRRGVGEPVGKDRGGCGVYEGKGEIWELQKEGLPAKCAACMGLV